MKTSVKEIQLLCLAKEKGMIDLEQIVKQIEMSKEKEYLDKHEAKIWEGTNKYWYTYLIFDGKRKLIKKRSKDLLEKAIIDYYKNNDPELVPTFKEEFAAWIFSKRKFNEVKESSLIKYGEDYKRYIEGTDFDNLKVAAINDILLDEFIRDTISRMELTAKAYSCLRTILLGTLKYAKRYHHTDFSPTIFFKDLDISKSSFKKPSDKRKKVFRKDEREILFNYLMSNQTMENLGLALMCLTGLRVGELSALKKEDNYESCHLYIHRTETRYLEDGKKKVRVQDTTKMDHDGDILIPKSAQRIIDISYMRSHGDEYLFSNNGVRITSRAFRYHLKKACEAIDIPYRSPHQMRKTYASILLASGVDEAIVKREMRHTQISTTRAYYQYITEKDDTNKAIIDEVMGL